MAYYFNAGRCHAGGIMYRYYGHGLCLIHFALRRSVYNGSAVTGVMYGPIMVELLRIFKLSIGSAILFIFIWKFFMLTLFLLCGASLFIS